MKALVFQGSGRCALVNRPTPVVELSTDAVVKVVQTTICDADLNIVRGGMPAVDSGRVLGHEGVGVVEHVGSAVANFRPGDRVLISCVSACGRCQRCRSGSYAQCARGGWLLGNTIDGTQAEHVRIPWADTSLHPLPGGADEGAFVMLSDLLPTGYECGVLGGRVSPGDTLAILGAGPAGLAVLITAQLHSPATIIVVDENGERLRTARELGATHLVNSAQESPIGAVMQLTEGAGADTAIDASGREESFGLCQQIVRAGGVIAHLGVHGRATDLQLRTDCSQSLTLSTRAVDTATTPLLMRAVSTGRLQAARLITHRFRLEEIMCAYALSGDAARARALKVLIHN